MVELFKHISFSQTNALSLMHVRCCNGHFSHVSALAGRTNTMSLHMAVYHSRRLVVYSNTIPPNLWPQWPQRL